MTDMRRQIKDQRVLKLLREFLKAGALENGLVGQARQGVPQGSPMSPLLSNIYLTALDLELEKRGLSYVRYADDIRVFLGSMKSAERVKASLSKWIQKKLRLTVNTSKSGIDSRSKSNFLGYTITRSQKRLPREKRKLVNAKINTLTKRRTSKRLKDIIQEINSMMRGWLQYYKLANIKEFIKRLVYRICRRLRCICLQKLKRFKTRVRFLVSQGINSRLARKQCKTGQGLMQMSQREGVKTAMPNRWFHSQGLINFYEELKRKRT
jgi:RNA-directed DNA polymerase